MSFPKACFFENRRKYSLGAAKGAVKTAKKPLQPRRNIEFSLLRGLKNIVIGFSLLSNLSGHAVEALSAFLRPCKRHIRNRAGNTAVALVEGMDRDEPQINHARFEHGVYVVGVIEPVDKGVHFLIERSCLGRLVMNALATNGSGDDLHRP